jgi:hypothetical protein
MRDPARIPVMMARLQTAWELTPDLRLGQLIGNAWSSDPYFVEDDEFVSVIEDLASRIKG